MDRVIEVNLSNNSGLTTRRAQSTEGAGTDGETEAENQERQQRGGERDGQQWLI